MSDNQVVTFTTDFGLTGPFVGVMKGVILKLNPQVHIVDVTNNIRPFDIREAAYTVGMNYDYFPARTIHLVIVDPGVGSKRRPLLAVTDKHYFIGPDNGVFSLVYAMNQEDIAVYHITADHYFLQKDSPTFQGRDIFAPVAAWLARGVSPTSLGDPITDYQTIKLPVPFLSEDRGLNGQVILIDRFGNAITNITKARIMNFLKLKGDKSFSVFIKGTEVLYRKIYALAEDDKIYALINSSECLEFFVNRDNAAAKYKIAVGDPVKIM